MNKIAIIHFYPPELYPPLQNLLTEMSDKQDCAILLLTNHVVNNDLSLFETKSSNIKIIRIARLNSHQHSLVRYGNYFLFYLIALWRLILFAPRSVLYFETLSSFPALVYQHIFEKSRLYIHYHEYTSEQEYQTGMLLNKLFHRWEKKIYPKAVWLSHTNHFRMTLFKRDLHPIQLNNTFLLPNYPPQEWRSKPKSLIHDPLLIVYAGAFSLETMYVREFANWVVSQKGKVLWDIYSYNLTKEVHQFIRGLNCTWIQLKPGVNYHELPMILKKYNIGVILYKGHIPNYIYNAPNKLFEYMACGIDVWFPDVMKGSVEYVTKKTYPKVISIDFENLEKINLDSVLSTEGNTLLEKPYYYQVALDPLIKKIVSL